MPTPENDQMVTVAKYSDVVQARLAQGPLAVEGIEPAEDCAPDAHAYSILSSEGGGVCIQVHFSIANQAKDILDRMERGEYEVFGLSNRRLMTT